MHNDHGIHYDDRRMQRRDTLGLITKLPPPHSVPLVCAVHSTHTRSMPQGLHSHSNPLLPTQRAKQTIRRKKQLVHPRLIIGAPENTIPQSVI